MRDVYIVLIFIVILIVVYVAMNKVHLPYKTTELTEFNTYCENGEIKLKTNVMGMGEMAFNMEASTKCIEYKTSRCKPMCENENPVCKCEASIFDQLFSSEGQWLLS